MNTSLVHTDPLLFNKSESLKDAFTLYPAKRKYLVVYEQGLEQEIINLLESSKHAGVEQELYEINEKINLEKITELFSKQKMGTQLYISSTWDTAVKIFEEAIKAGFTEEEMELVIAGPKRRYVYCMKCFELNEIDIKEKEVECSSCEIMLSVGPFFSRARKGYIGYPFKPTK